MRRQVNYPALAWLIVVLLGTAVALRLAWQSFLANPQLLQAGRPVGWASTFGIVATLIIVVAAPLVAWLVHRAFFSRSEEHTSELQSLMRISYAVFCLKKKNLNPLEVTNIFQAIIRPTRPSVAIPISARLCRRFWFGYKVIGSHTQSPVDVPCHGTCGPVLAPNGGQRAVHHRRP